MPSPIGGAAGELLKRIQAVADSAKELAEGSQSVTELELRYLEQQKTAPAPTPSPTPTPQSDTTLPRANEVISADQAEEAYGRVRRRLHIQRKRVTSEWLAAGDPKTWGQLTAYCSLDWLVQTYVEDHQDTLPEGKLPPLVYSQIISPDSPPRQECHRLVHTSLGPNGELPHPDRLRELLEHEYPRFERWVNDLRGVDTASEEENQEENETTNNPEETEDEDNVEAARHRQLTRLLLAEHLMDATRISDVSDEAVDRCITAWEESDKSEEYGNWLYALAMQSSMYMLQAVDNYLRAKGHTPLSDDPSIEKRFSLAKVYVAYGATPETVGPAYVDGDLERGEFTGTIEA